MFENVPEELKQLPRWVNWRHIHREGKWTKPPYQPSGALAKSDQPETWNTFETCRDAAASFCGVGFVLTAEDDLVGIDLDKCHCPAFDLTAHWAEEIIENLDSYTEKSPSGRGFRIITRGILPPGRRKKGSVEVYDSGRYLTITGHKLNGRGIEERQEALRRFHVETFGKAKKDEEERSSPPPGDWRVRLERAFLAKNGADVRRLYDGDHSSHASHSEADLALCSHLAFWLDRDVTAIDQAFKESGLYRPKWDTKHNADGRSYGQLTIDRAISSMKETFGGHPGVTAAETAMGFEIPVADIVEAAHHGQKGCADLFSRLNRGRLCFDHAARLWYRFGDHAWVLDDLEVTLREIDTVQSEYRRALGSVKTEIVEVGLEYGHATMAGNQAQAAALESKLKSLEKQRKPLNIVINALNTLYYRKQVAEFAAVGAESLGVSGDDWDLDPWSLAVKNGVVNLRTGNLRPGKPEDYVRAAAPTAFDPTAQCPQFEKFLIAILDGDEEVAQFLKRLLGAALIGDATQKQYVAIFSGAGRNGKDTLMGIIAHVLGLNLCAPIPAELLLDSNNKRSSQGPSADLMKLRGLRLAYCNETSEGRRFNSGLVKQLSGGGMMTAREPYGRRNVDWQQRHMLMLMTNRRPHAPIDDYAFWKRVRNVHFPLSFVLDPTESHERKADPAIGERLKVEAPGILTWLVCGCLEYQAFGLPEPAAVKAATAQYIRDVDLLGLFLEERCVVGDGYRTTRGDLFGAYREWSQDNNHRPISGTAFGRDMVRRFQKEGKNYIGVGLLNDH